MFYTLSPIQSSIIEATKKFAKKHLNNAEGGHNYWHAIRVYNLANEICDKEDADIFVIQIAALLHDIADSKFYNGDENIGSEIAGEFLKNHNVNHIQLNHIVNIIKYISFSKSFDQQKFDSIELDIVRDADMLDAIGAIGIARTFNYGGFKGNELHNPNIPPRKNMTKEEYKTGKSTTINHFYEKLFLLKDKMKTKKAQEMAIERHKYMEDFVNRFDKEWKGKI